MEKYKYRLTSKLLNENQDQKPGYYYEHTNGEIIFKPKIVVDMGGGPSEYFNSPFVKKWWEVKDQNIKEQDESNGADDSPTKSKEDLKYNIVITPVAVSADEVVKALENVDNYGAYVSNLRNSKSGIEKAVEDHFGPNQPWKKKSLEKERGKPFPPKTKQAVDAFIKTLTSKPNLLNWEIEGDTVVFPHKKNPTKQVTRNIIDTVMKKANIDYDIDEKEAVNESIIKLKQIIKEEIDKVLNETDINDPVLMKLRALKDKEDVVFKSKHNDKTRKVIIPKNFDKIKALEKERAELMRDMESDPDIEIEGGPVADRYGEELNRIDQQINKLKGIKNH